MLAQAVCLALETFSAYASPLESSQRSPLLTLSKRSRRWIALADWLPLPYAYASPSDQSIEKFETLFPRLSTQLLAGSRRTCFHYCAEMILTKSRTVSTEFRKLYEEQKFACPSAIPLSISPTRFLLSM